MKEGSPLVRRDPPRGAGRGGARLARSDLEKPEGKPANVASQMRFARGDVEQGFAEADLVVDRTYRTPVVHQGYLEPQATIVDYDAASGEMTIYTGTQGQFDVRDEIARMLQLPQTKVRVVGLEVGGGFGAKTFLYQGLCAALAVLVKRPVKL